MYYILKCFILYHFKICLNQLILLMHISVINPLHSFKILLQKKSPWQSKN